MADEGRFAVRVTFPGEFKAKLDLVAHAQVSTPAAVIRTAAVLAVDHEYDKIVRRSRADLRSAMQQARDQRAAERMRRQEQDDAKKRRGVSDRALDALEAGLVVHPPVKPDPDDVEF